MKRLYTAALALALLWGGQALADGHGHKKHVDGMKKEMKADAGLAIEGAWARASTPRAKNGAAYVTIVNHGMKADRLVAAASAVAAKVELHTHKMDGGVMRMRQIPSVDVPAHGSAELKPGGDHIMLLGLKKPLKVGEHLKLTLTFESGRKKTIDVMIMKKGSAKKMKHNH